MDSVTEGRQVGVEPVANPPAAEVIGLLRRFHHGDPAVADALPLPGAAILPALLDPYRDASAIRYQYPLYLPPPGDDPDAPLAVALTEHLAGAVAEFAPGEDDARVLKDNLPWLERDMRQRLDRRDPVDAARLFAAAAAALQEHLSLGEDARAKLDADLGKLGAALPDGGRLLAYGPDVPLHLLVHAQRQRCEPRREALHERVRKTAHKLGSLLQVDRSKTGRTDKSPDAADPASRHLDTGALSGMLGKRTHGAVTMSAERRSRVEDALQVLESWQDEPVLLHFVGHIDNAAFGKQSGLEVTESDDPCTAAAEIFQRDAERFAKLFAALRIAELEIDDRYDPAVHDSWFDCFDWQALSDDELKLVTRVVALVPANQLAGDSLPSFSKLLSSRLPVLVLSWVRAYDNPAVKPGEGPFDAYRFELAYFGVGHRQVIVAQTSAARYEDLLAGFVCALDNNRTSLHLVNRGTQSKAKQAILDPWFVASAALESRAHPFLLVNPDAGDYAAERVNFEGNPQSDRDWPTDKLEYRAQDGEMSALDLAFTFADYALLMPALHDYFRKVPAGLESEDLVPIADYLDSEGEAVDRRIPFVWGIDKDGVLARFVVARPLVFACRDRLNYWHTLQELAGIHNFYVDQAIARVTEEQQAASQAEREQLLADHEQALKEVRAEATDQAMGQLVDVLMGADLSAIAGEGRPVASMPAAEADVSEAPAAASAEAETEPEAAVEEEAEDELSFDEPWLDSDSCTTCDDCMGINKQMFAYNDNKQAYIVDPRAGPYADLVKAAEICPAKCIHPGKPLDPNEPGLEELIARAAPYN